MVKKALIRVMLWVSNVVIAILSLILLVFGCVIRGVFVVDRLLKVVGIVGIITSAVGFAGSFFNLKSNGPFFQRILLIVITVFLITECILHIALVFAGVFLLRIGDIIEIMEGLGVLDPNDTTGDLGFTRRVGAFAIVCGALVAVMILITVFHMGFVLFQKLYPSILSVLHLFVAVLILILIVIVIREYFIFKFYLPYVLGCIFLFATGIIGIVVALRRFKFIAQWVERPYYVVAILSVVGMVYVVGTITLERNDIERFYDGLCISQVDADTVLCSKWLDRMSLAKKCETRCEDSVEGYCSDRCNGEVGPPNINPCYETCMNMTNNSSQCIDTCKNPDANPCVNMCVQDGGNLDDCSTSCSDPNHNPYWPYCIDPCKEGYMDACPGECLENAVLPAMDELEHYLTVIYDLVIFVLAYMLGFFVISTTSSIVLYCLSAKDKLTGERGSVDFRGDGYAGEPSIKLIGSESPDSDSI